jgi:hypothetical protein
MDATETVAGPTCVCGRCGETRPKGEFGKRGRRVCLACKGAAYAAWIAAHRTLKPPPSEWMTCALPGCGVRFTQLPGSGRTRRYCSERCRQAAPRATRRDPKIHACVCLACGVEFRSARKAQRYCSYRCSRLAARAPLETVPCGTCGKPMTRRVCKVDADNRFCSRACCHASLRVDPEVKRANLAEGRRRHCRKRRFAKRSLPTEKYKDREIFERDGWRCALCGKRIDRALRWPHPMSATIDHIVPFTKGGADTRRNVQAAHARCNTAKSNRLAGGRGDQLLLVG